MKKIFLNPSQIITVDTKFKNLKRGKELNEINCLSGYSLIIEDDIIADLVPNSSIKNQSEFQIINCEEKIILPGLIECHTHTAFAGSRADEFRKKISGISYEEIAKQGGGINATVSAIRKATFEELVNTIKPRVDYFISQGITTLEIKSGYGLDFENEMKLLHVIKYLDEIFPITIVPTFLGAHSIPNEFKNQREKYIDLINSKMIPHIAENNLAVFCDGFCEKTAFTPQEIDSVFNSASIHGLKIKLHTDQFNSFGGIDTALKYKATSIDHLEVIINDEIKKIAKSDIVCILLPGVSFFLNYEYAPARELIDNNVIVALATDYNPGSSHIANLNLVMSIASIKMKMTIEETISAVTINAAKALDLSDKIGSIEIGKKADFAIFDANDYADIVYNVGKNLNIMTVKNGDIIYYSKGVEN
jgi:imidazolonepropionase